MWADGGGKARGAAIWPLHGPVSVAEFVLASTRFLPLDYHVETTSVNGQLAVILRVDNKAVFVIAIEVDENQIRELRVIGNPDKLRCI